MRSTQCLQHRRKSSLGCHRLQALQSRFPLESGHELSGSSWTKLLVRNSKGTSQGPQPRWRVKQRTGKKRELYKQIMINRFSKNKRMIERVRNEEWQGTIGSEWGNDERKSEGRKKINRWRKNNATDSILFPKQTELNRSIISRIVFCKGKLEGNLHGPQEWKSSWTRK